MPIKPITLNSEQLKKMNLIAEYKQSYDYIDNELAKENINIGFDDRINSITMNNYNEESYELFR